MLISGLDHVQITVEPEHEHAALAFYRDALALEEIPKPANLKKNGGAWFKLGNHELHVSPEKQPLNNAESKRHICYITDNIEAVKSHLARLGVAVIPDKQPVDDWIRFYLRDPAGNRLEIAQKVTRS